jgi:Na+/proline symporter
VVTDLELTELRYGGRPAAVLRASRAFLLAVPLNCIGIGYGMLAMRKVVVALGILDGLPSLPGDPRLWVILPIVLITLVYTAASGLWGVVATDFVQYILAMAGAVIVMVYALNEVGGVGAMTSTLRAQGQGARLDLVPLGPEALMPMTTFLGYIGIQWWAYRNSDGGGMLVQRLASTADEKDATRAAHAFNILNYVVRTWPWVLVALAALIIMPGLSDPEMAYPLLMARYLPAGLLGLVFASLLAAFMSTVSTQVNWGASYLVNDVYGRFSGEKDEARLLRAARWASIGITLAAAGLSFFMESVGQVFRFLVLIGSGTGAVLLIRWFWWRVNAWTEITAMLVGMVLAIFASMQPWTWGSRLAFTTFGTMAVWLPVTFLTRPERNEVLDGFYARIRPAGWWHPVRARTGLTPLDSLARDGGRWLVWVIVILGATLGIGWVLLL